MVTSILPDGLTLRLSQAKLKFKQMKTVEAVIEPTGEVHLAEPVHVTSPRRALVTILEEAPGANETTLLSEASLEDWNRPEEEAAWAHLQPAK
jgi:hypothetical protein